MSKTGRIRTESMIDRLGRKPLSDGFDMWDKDYRLGALRLFQCKLEVAPPFEQAACLDAVAEILSGIEEPEEAVEHYNQAIAKYEMIGNAVLAELMRCKAFELNEGTTTEQTLEKIEKYLNVFDERRSQGKTGPELLGPEAKGKSTSLGRFYLYQTEILGELGRHEEALKSIEVAKELGLERMHLLHGVMGDVLRELDRQDEAIASYEEAIRVKPTFVAAYKSLLSLLTDQKQTDKALKLIETALALHPNAHLIREQAFLLSNQSQDDEALSLLDSAIKNPPADETDAISVHGNTQVSILRKAKTAILADLERFPEANEVLSDILAEDPDDDEAISMRTDVYITIYRDQLEKSNKEWTASIESTISDVVRGKPQITFDALVDSL